MNTHEKSLELAKLMGWTTHTMGGDFVAVYMPIIGNETLAPYSDDRTVGLAQFAVILLKFPEVMEHFVRTASSASRMDTPVEGYERYGGDCQGVITERRKVTQENILDEILKMKGVKL